MILIGSRVPEKYRKWLTLFGGFLIHLSLGSINTYGNITPYLTSYLRVYVKSSTTYSQTAYIYTSLGVAIALSAIASGILRLKLKLSLKTTTLIGCLIME